jgi:putative intracellular protease/amidase
MTRKKVLVIGSNADRIEIKGGASGPTGQYLNETVVPILTVMKAGFDIVLATPKGTKPHIDAASLSAQHFGGDEAAFSHAKAFFADDPSMNRVRTLRSVIDEGLDNYAAVFVPGGQAPVVDLMQDPEVGEILRHFHTHKKPTALLCHGPIAVIAAMPSAREFRASLVAGDTAKAAQLALGWQYTGYQMTVFSKTEETVIEDKILHGKMYFNMVDALTVAGAKVTVGNIDFAPHVVEDRELITGQNPRSDHLVGEKLVEALEREALRA